MKNQMTCLLMFILLAVATSAAQSPKPRSLANKSGVQKPTIDPCSLLTSGDIQAVQGETVQETKPGTQQGGGLVMSHCVFRTAAPSKSVSVSLASADSSSARAFWTRQFHSGKSDGDAEHSATGAKKSALAPQEKEEESTRPRPIPGVGEEAYWVGGPLVGALYVLKRDAFIRISVGGIRRESERIQKSIALARDALKRL